MTRRLLTTIRGRDRGRSRFVQAQDDPKNFVLVYDEYYEPLLGYFARRVLDPDTAFDLMAETLTTALTHLADLRGATEEQGRAWLWAIARSQLAHWHRRGQVDRRCREVLAIELPAQRDAEWARAEELADLFARRAEIEQGLEDLSDDQAQAIRLRYLEDQSLAQIAQLLGISEKAVHMRVSRGLQTLGKLLEPLREPSS